MDVQDKLLDLIGYANRCSLCFLYVMNTVEWVKQGFTDEPVCK